MNNLKKLPLGVLVKHLTPLKPQYAYKSQATAMLQYYASNTIIGLYKTYRKLSSLMSGKQTKQIEAPKDTVVIYQFPRAHNTPSLSPFALKLETYCRAANINYQNRFGMKFSSQGLIPFIELNKFIVEDSSKCIEYLGEVFQKDLDAHLTDEQKAISQALIKMAEDSCVALMRFWFLNSGRNDMKLPLLAYWNFSYRVYRRAWYNGYGRQSREDVFENICKNLTAINVLIGKKKYLFSDTEPSVADFTVFGICTQIVYNDSGPTNKFLKTKCHNIIRHVENMKETYWQDWNTEIRAKIAKNI